MAWCFDNEFDQSARDFQGELKLGYAEVPAIWSIEVCSTMIIGARRNRLTDTQMDDFLDLIGSFDIRIAPPVAIAGIAALIEVAQRERLSSYDAAYLDLAMQTGLPLATRDQALAAAAQRNGVDLVPA